MLVPKPRKCERLRFLINRLLIKYRRVNGAHIQQHNIRVNFIKACRQEAYRHSACLFFSQTLVSLILSRREGSLKGPKRAGDISGRAGTGTYETSPPLNGQILSGSNFLLCA